jgi:CubicO group peptidase (beta-lactamase class C family)
VACGPAAPPERASDSAPSPTVDQRLERLESALPGLLTEGRIPGLSVAVARQGEIAWARGFGTTAADAGQPVGKNTVFGAASLTKPVVAYAVMRLADAGEIDIDRPLADYLLYEDVADDPRAARITARMVLSHSTGLPNWRPGRWSDDPQPLTTQFEPGSRWQYSGEGFVYLQRVVERLTGVTLDQLLRKMVFEPLVMTSSSLIWEERFERNYALPHHEDLTPRDDRRPREPLAAGTLQTTAADYARFLIAVMDGKGLAPGTLAAILKPQVEVRPGVQWGLGWGIEEGSAGSAIWQWGHDPGNRAFVIAVPERRFGMVFFSNSDNGMLLLRRIVEGTLGGVEHPARDHLDYDSIDSPRRLVTMELERVALDGGAAVVQARYRELAAIYPEAPFSERVLNRLGYNLLGRERVDAAIAFFELNVEAYPEASNPYDSLGEAYMVRGDRELAIANYERSLELDPDNANAVAMLAKLRAPD